MTSLAEVFDYKDSSIVPTYSESEGGYAFPGYQVKIAVSMGLNDETQRKLESHFSPKGYTCVFSRTRNLVTISRLDGIDRRRVMRFICRIDPNAREVA